jgi:hypothetical protein
MQRQGLVAAAVVVALVSTVVILARRGGVGTQLETPGTERVFVSDSLGIRLRLPDSPEWSLRREPVGSPDGRVVSAIHTGEKAVVRVFALPATPGTKLDDVFAARQRQFATVFNVPQLDAIVSKVLADEKKELNGRTFRQWQAITKPGLGTGEAPATFVFMWLQTVDPVRSLECIGLVRAPVQPTPEERTAADRLLAEVAYILQSFEVR